jgi:CheY-like chemotaxis protein
MGYQLEAKNSDVLIAKEDLENALICKMILENSKHNVHISIDGKDCLKRYEQAYYKDRPLFYEGCFYNGENPARRFDVVVLDVNLLHVDGIEVAEQIYEICPQQKILLLVSDTNKGANSGLRMKSSIEVIEKPIEPNSLASKIERMLFANQIN